MDSRPPCWDSQTDIQHVWATRTQQRAHGGGGCREEVKAAAALAVAAWEQQVEQDFSMRDAAYKQLKEDLQMRDGEVLNNVDVLVTAVASRVDQQVPPLLPIQPYSHIRMRHRPPPYQYSHCRY